MNLQRAIRFLRKSPDERRTTVRFFARKGLARLPYVPVRICLTVPPDTEIKFWWSYVSESDFADRPLLDYWGSDLGELRFLWRILQPGMVFFDIGAFHGLYSLIAAKKLRGAGKLVAFEPSPRERSRFQLHLRLNGLSDVRLEPFALRAQRGSVKLFIVVAGLTSMNSLVAPPIQNKVREVSVESLTLDEYVEQENIRHVDVMKVDTEGAEREIFAGGQRVLSEHRPFIICEVLDWVTGPWGYPAREIVSALGAYDYKWFDFRPDGMLVPHESREEYSEVRNYLAAPREILEPLSTWIQT